MTTTTFKTIGRRSALALMLGTITALATAPAMAQGYPDKPVRIIVPFTAGGLADVLARGIGNELGKTWGQAVIIDNRPGANTIIAADATAKSAPDGYTLLMANDPTLSSNQYLYSRLPYDPVKDFVPVINVAATLEILIVPNDSKAKNVGDVIAMAKAAPGTLTYGTYGPGSKAHFDAEEFSTRVGIKLNHIPYKGVADTMIAAASGQIDMSFSGVPPALQMVKSGKIRALAIAAPQRSPVLPDVPTFAEAGVPGFESKAWFGLVAPAGTPQAVVDKIAADVAKIIVKPDFQDKFITGVGLTLVNQGPREYADFLKRDREEYAKEAKIINVKLD
jgi:tripartite-type tricarboxylate transporter receptor subunit TctC